MRAFSRRAPDATPGRVTGCQSDADARMMRDSAVGALLVHATLPANRKRNRDPERRLLRKNMRDEREFI
jgi:hypothetical protein